MISRLLFLLVVLTSIFRMAEAAQCSATFVDGLNNSDTNGKIKFENSAQLLNNLDSTLATTFVENINTQASCVTGNCNASGDSASALSGSYISYTSDNNYLLENNAQGVIPTNDYQNVEVKSGSRLYMSSTFSSYHFKKLKVHETSFVHLTAGDYYLEEIEIKSSSQLIIDGPGYVRIFVTNKANFKESALINGGISGNPLKLIVYFFADDDDKIKVESNATFAGYIYSENKVEVKGGNSKVLGAISSVGELKLKNGAKVTAANLEPDFGDLCDSAYNLTGNMTVDNTFNAYISTDDSVQGTLISSDTVWETTNQIATTLTEGLDYYLHIYATDVGGVAGFLGDFEIMGTNHTFSNGLTTLNTNTTDWVVSKTGWSNYQSVSGYGINGVAPWGTRAGIDNSAQWIWSSNNDADDVNYFSTKVVASTSSTIPILDYRFDDCSYTEAGDEVDDEIGSFNGVPNGLPDPIEGGVVNKSLDLSANDTSDWIYVPNNAVNGLNDFSVSVWFKTSIAKPQQNILHALGSSPTDDELEIHLIENNIVYIKVKNISQQLTSNIVLTNGDWHQLVLVRVDENVCLFIDGVKQPSCGSVGAGELSVTGNNAVVIGQEQDAFGGNFNSEQSFQGQLDEFKIYDSKLDDTEINNIYTNELAQNNYDGTTRDAVECEQIEAVAGRVTLNNTTNDPSFTHVCFDTPFSVVPVVFSLPTTANNADRLALRIRNVTVNGFDIAQVESPEDVNPNSPAGNLPQTVDFLAIVKGDYDLDGGAKMRVSTKDTTRFQGRSFNSTVSWEIISTADLGFTQTPSIIASIQTMENEPNNSNGDGPFPISNPFLATAITSVSTDTFNIALERGETNSGTIDNDETIGYIAISSGFQGNLTSEIKYESFRTSNNITGLNSCQSFDLADNYTANPLVIASQNTRDGDDGGWLKRCSISTTNVGFSIVEDADGDTDTGHTTEIAGGLALGGTFNDFTDSCPKSSIDHYQIEHNGNGLTCSAETITIKACTNSACSPVSSEVVSLDFQSDGITKEALTFTGSTMVSLSQTTADILTLGLINETIPPANATVCIGGNPNLCDLVFTDTGFRFFENIESNPIPTQVSAKPSNTLKIQAIEKNSDTGACQAVFIDTTAIEMAATCVDPTACAGSQVAINTDNITTLDNISPLSYSSVNLNFNDNTVNSAEFIFTYPDAGKIKLHARYNIPDENGDPSGNYMLGSSNQFVVRPFGFFIDVVNNPKATTATEAKFIAAGAEFTTIVKAVQWQADNDTDLSNNPVTKNFGSEANAETVEVTPNMVLPNLSTLPSPGILGTLSSNIFNTFSLGTSIEQGIATNSNMTYSEVGIISFTANLTDNSYLGADNVVGNEPYVGRFVPDHFVLVKVDGDLATYCENPTLVGDIPFAYSGQMNSVSSSTGAIRYKVSLNPSFTITAKSLGSVNTTVNYTGNFMKLIGSSITRLAPSFDYAENGSLGTKLALTADLKAVNTSDLVNDEALGVITYTYNEDDNFVYHHELNAEINKFTTDINLPIVSVIDPDGVTALDADGDFDNDGNLSNALDSVLTLEPVGVEIRFGRAQLENSYGPETSNLPQPLSVNYFKDGQYIVAEDDKCTPYNATEMSLTNIDLINFSLVPALPAITPVSGQFIDGTPPGMIRAIELTAPGAGNTGQVCVSYAIAPWLQYKWATDPGNLQCPFTSTDVDGLFNDNPFSMATFGIFRGNDRIIYQREIEK